MPPRALQAARALVAAQTSDMRTHALQTLLLLQFDRVYEDLRLLGPMLLDDRGGGDERRLHVWVCTEAFEHAMLEHVVALGRLNHRLARGDCASTDACAGASIPPGGGLRRDAYDLPVPAAPVKKTLSPSRTAASTAFCPVCTCAAHTARYAQPLSTFPPNKPPTTAAPLLVRLRRCAQCQAGAHSQMVRRHVAQPPERAPLCPASSGEAAHRQ